MGPDGTLYVTTSNCDGGAPVRPTEIKFSGLPPEAGTARLQKKLLLEVDRSWSYRRRFTIASSKERFTRDREGR